MLGFRVRLGDASKISPFSDFFFFFSQFRSKNSDCLSASKGRVLSYERLQSVRQNSLVHAAVHSAESVLQLTWQNCCELAESLQSY